MLVGERVDFKSVLGCLGMDFKLLYLGEGAKHFPDGNHDARYNIIGKS